MQALLQDKGGNYVKDYMAATPEEALENFPNMLILTRPLLVRFNALKGLGTFLAHFQKTSTFQN